MGFRFPRSTCTLGLVLIFLAAGSAGTGSQSELVIYKEGTKLYHRPGCPVVAGASDVLALTRAQAEGRGYKAHPECDPSNPAAPRVGAGTGRQTGPAPTEVVYLGDAKYYHRKECTRLKGVTNPKSVALASAAKSHWPCPACKAPILKRSNEPAIPGTNRRRAG
jgi:hypothetical protein